MNFCHMLQNVHTGFSKRILIDCNVLSPKSTLSLKSSFVSGCGQSNVLHIRHVVNAKSDSLIRSGCFYNTTFRSTSILHLSLICSRLSLHRPHVSLEYGTTKLYLSHQVYDQINHDIKESYREVHFKFTQSYDNICL
ncbi:hypothetical protein RND81_10G042500 [Saponaria officinalis]|uniref:Uncharacterized protein n=1 Tax=Saponaria officinalis TaxID=3572 RepID=A0AAW1HXQ4_SAPOF